MVRWSLPVGGNKSKKDMVDYCRMILSSIATTSLLVFEAT